MKYLISTFSVALISLTTINGQRLPEAKLTLRVVNDKSVPMGDVDASISFEQPKYSPGRWGSSDVLSRKGKTDYQGLFSAAAPASNYVNYSARTVGFYKSHGQPVEFSRSENGKWQPWNPTVEVILKKIIDPIPMYARRMETQLPALDAPVGFDLMKADWIAPYGQGNVSDLVFKLTKRVESFHDFGAELLLTFSNKGDGIQMMPVDKSGSELRSPHVAPENGYGPLISLLQGNSKQGGQYGLSNKPRDYLFRVRTVTDSKGKVVSALYGKIYGSIEYFPVSHKTAKLRFTYYLNPTPNDRNMEFDPKRNLFKNLKPDEQVREP
jgi:hypothetical protein